MVMSLICDGRLFGVTLFCHFFVGDKVNPRRGGKQAQANDTEKEECILGGLF